MAADASGHGAAERIAGSEPCSVYRCPCGCVHVNIGSITLRLGADEFRDVASTLGRAASALDGRGAAPRRH